ncbi:MAG TPA: T9SS type A sorting domain-containing protein [Ignavibacteriaceae bacterium]|nr:T9SS type A sorting domain-containing protein [Ignavibacteriaceae bacterium]
MRNLLVAASVLFLSSIELFPQWSTDPNNNLIVGYGLNPELCSDSAGGCYITYEAGYPAELHLRRLDRYGYQPWGDKRKIAGELEEQMSAKIIGDGEGGVIVSYGDRIFHSRFRLRIQKVDSSGNLLWGATGRRVSVVDTSQSVQRMVTDGAGGCVIVWMESNMGFAEYRINRIDRNGQRVWSDTGLYIISDYNYDPPILTRASDGSYYLKIRRNLYRLNQNGEVVRRDSVTLGYPVADSDGGLILSGRTGTINNIKLVSQRKDSLGNNLWQDPYVEIADSLYLNSPITVRAIYGYYYYWWYRYKNGIQLVTQYQVLRPDGTKLFPNGSINISNYPVDALLADILPSDTGTVVFIWQDYRSDDGVFGQRKDTLNNRLWNLSDVPLYTGMYSDLFAITDCLGGAIGLGWHQFDFSLRMFKVSKNGIMGEVIVPVELISFSGKLVDNLVELYWQTATETNNMGFEIERLQNSKIDGLSEWKKIGFVQGFGTTTEPKSYSFIDKVVTTGIYKYRLKQIDYDGSFEYSNIAEVAVGNPSGYLLEQNYPNPFNSSTIIKYQIPKDESVRINLYNILGEKILTLFEGEQESGEHQIRLSSDKLPSGNYFYSLEAASTRQIKKLTIIK